MRIHQIRKIHISGFFLLIAFGFVTCQNQEDRASAVIVKSETGNILDKTLTPFCQSLVSDFDLPGMAVGVVKDNEIVYAKGFGYENIHTKEPVTIASLFHMASISKPFVATAIMQLVEQDKMHLDSALITYLPYFKINGELYDKITIKQILNHISGMPDVRDYEWADPVYDGGALERYVHSISHEELIARPGERYAYSNMAFECLGDAIAKVSGLTFAEYVKQNILNPAGMKESTFLKPETLPEHWAAPHLRYAILEPWDGYPYNRMHGPSSTLHSSVLEMCNWAIINLNRGTNRGSTILNSSSYETLWKPWFKTGDRGSVGLSWFLGEYRGETTIGHSGGDTGFNTNLLLLPEKSIAVVVLSNVSPAPVDLVTNAALNVILGYEIDSHQKPAIIPVSKELEQKGIVAAVAMWDSVKTNHPAQYDFNAQLFRGLYNAADSNRQKEANLLTELFVRILDEEVIEALKEEVEYFIQENPDNSAVSSALKVIEEHMNSLDF
jgi:CubicO group peptidase (beta-lactamase class C family)